MAMTRLRRRDGQPQGAPQPHRLGEGDAEDHQGDADGRRVEAPPRAGRGRGGAALCGADGRGPRQPRHHACRPRRCAAAPRRHRQGPDPSARRLHGRSRPLRRLQFVDRAARPRPCAPPDGRGQGGEVLLRRQEGLRRAPPALRQADHRHGRARERQADRLRRRRRHRQAGAGAVRRGRVRRLHALLRASSSR